MVKKDILAILELNWITIQCNFLEENLKTESDPARAECDDATSRKGCQIWVISWWWIKPDPAIGIDNDLDEEGGVDKEKVDRDPNLQVPRLLSSPVAPQRDGGELAHVALEKIPHCKVFQKVGNLQKE